MTIEEMNDRRAVLITVAIELNHSPVCVNEYRMAEHWIKREIARYDRKIAALIEVKRRLGVAGYLNSCKSCWWREGDRCYLPGTFNRIEGGRSDKLAINKCDGYESKRSVLGAVFPEGMLTIASEENAKKMDKL